MASVTHAGGRSSASPSSPVYFRNSHAMSWEARDCICAMRSTSVSSL